MILGIIGVFIVIFSAMKDTGVSVWGIIAGIVLIIMGLTSISWSSERNRARKNRQRYWAYGKAPDWAEKKQNRRK